ncbi:HlyD family type I secretion periplasmic adaptor subunit [Xanthobacter sp. KR7-225]|uniref:HlyD family type I secretion periplasmic adaptor subunit n=1 Tax=Xanthobacter sp. KR7-225 TaxID=3156613 RepID=UPI0032B3DDCB
MAIPAAPPAADFAPDGPSPAAAADFRPLAWAGYLVIAATFLGLGGWAALASIEGAVVAPGVVVVEGKRQVVQHLEGGIVGAIHVREGDLVAQDQVLFRLDPTQPKATDDAARAQLRAALALEARLVAERDGAASVAFPPELTAQAGLAAVRAAMADQEAQFRDRRTALAGQLDILAARLGQFAHEMEGLKQERAAARQQLAFIDDELDAVRLLARKGLVNKARVSGLEREKARLEGLVGRNLADAAKAEGAAAEVRLQMAQLHQKRAEETGAALAEVRQKRADLAERARVAASVLERVEIRAPRAGTAQNLNPRIYTVGAVVRPGDTLVEIVPLDAPLVVDAQVAVEDVDRLEAEGEVEVRFPAFHGRETPLVLGRLASVSRDRLVDEATHRPYFLARVAVADTDVPLELRRRLRPGMGAELAFATGARPVLSYLLRPLGDALGRAFTER